MGRILRRAFWLSLFVGLIAPVAHGQAGVVPTMGKEFWIGFMKGFQGGAANSLDVFISSPVNTSGVLTMPLTGTTIPFSVTANVTTTVTLPNVVAAMHFGSEVVDNKSILIQTQDTVAVFAINFEQYTADAAVIYPVQSLGTDYRVFCYYGYGGIADLVSEFLIVATKDGTEVEITATANTAGGHLAGVPWIVQLDSGETYQVQAQSDATDLQGSLVRGTAASGSCRPFAVFGGSVCTKVPNSCTACDHVYDQNLPTSAWGTKYYTVPFSQMSGYTYRIMARDNGTQVTINGGAPIAFSAGQWTEYNFQATANCIESNLPISVAQYMEGVTCNTLNPNLGDPALLILNAEEQQIDRITFGTVVSTVITSHFLNIVTETANTASVYLDGAQIPLGTFSAYPACPTMSYGSVTLTPGSHTLECVGGLSAYVYGAGSAETYAYSVGAFTPVPPLVVDSVFCGLDSTGTLTLAPPVPIFNPWWNTISNPADTLYFGLSYTFVPPASDVYVVTGYENQSFCEQQYFFSVEIDDPPVLDMFANGVAGPAVIQVCAYEEVQLEVVPNPAGTYLYNWWPDAPLDDGSLPNPIATPAHSGWFYVSVSTLNGCAVAVDSIYIEVIPGDVLLYEATSDPTMLCAGDSAQLNLEIHQTIVSDTLDTALNPALWSTTAGGALSNVCGSIGGNALHFDGPGPTREAQTVDLNLLQGGTIRFNLKISDGVAPCDNADPGEDVLLQYSTNGGGAWTTINTYWEYLYATWTQIDEPIPAGAMTASTRFRWVQPNFTGAGEDNWQLDDVSIAVENAVGLTISWTPAATLSNAGIIDPMAYPVTSGWYYVTSTDVNTSCQYNDSLFIDVGQPFTLTMTPDTAICDIAGIQLDAIPSGGTNHDYLWAPNTNITSIFAASPTVTPVVTTTYTVTVTSQEGCTAAGDVQIIVSAALNLTVTTTDADICAGDIVTLNANVGGAANMSFQWAPLTGLSNGNVQSPNAQPMQDEWYSVIATDTLSGCVLADSVFINVTNVSGVFAGNDTTVCSALGMQLGVTYSTVNPIIQWEPAQYLNFSNTAAPTITFDSTMTYIVEVGDGVNCSAFDTVTVTVSFSSLTFIADSSLCQGQSMVIDAGYPWADHSWSTGDTSQTITVNSAGAYTCTMTDTQLGCSVSFTTNVTVDPLPVVYLGPDTSLCVGQNWLLDAGNPGSTYLWNTTAQTQTISTTVNGPFSVDVIDGNDCLNSDTIAVVFDPLPVIVISDTVVCVSETITLNAGNPGAAYLWSPTGETTQTIDVTATDGTYSVVVTTPTICTDSAEATLIFIPFPVVDLGADTALCDTEQLTLDAQNDTCVFTWSTGANSQTITLIESENVWVDVYNDYCVTRDSINVVFNPLPNELSVSELTICLDYPPYHAVLSGENPGNTYVWSPTGETTQIILAEDYGWFMVQLTTPLDCSILDSILVQEYCHSAIYVPNTFTPDGDGVNDMFFPNGHNIAAIELRIFDRWGEMIKSGTDTDAKWDGTYGGATSQDGVYIWKVKYRFFENAEHTVISPDYEQTGHVTLVR
ncbi:MAG: gliding motility-associated C-terminal domain-containing protein [Flavobacteriales bacterium]|nr:gliding motility-associated C-terminal domain-containing protein [Flavobacteriales bacterium]MBK9195174.1 gliding motility-associated C-terminal domain-containing protein [Flavobacteriales bacterium]